MGRSGGGGGRSDGGRSGGGGRGNDGGYRQVDYGGQGPINAGGPPPRRGGFWHRRGGGGCFGLGCGGTAAIIAIIAVVLGIILSSVRGCAYMGMSSNSTSYTSETSETVREKLDASAVDETGWYTDEDDLIGSSSTLEAGLEEFYEATGVQPYVYILESESVSSVNEVTEQAEELYDELFTDEGHFLVVFCENSSYDSYDDYGYSDEYGTDESYTAETSYLVQTTLSTVEDSDYDYYYGYYVGEDATTVLDTEALEIFDEELSAAYYNYDLAYEEVFAQAFEYTAENIMSAAEKQTTTRLVTGIILVVVVVVVVVLIVYYRKRKQQQEDEERRRRADDVAGKTYSSYDDQDVEDRASKYE